MRWCFRFSSRRRSSYIAASTRRGRSSDITASTRRRFGEVWLAQDLRWPATVGAAARSLQMPERGGRCRSSLRAARFYLSTRHAREGPGEESSVSTISSRSLTPPWATPRREVLTHPLPFKKTSGSGCSYPTSAVSESARSRACASLHSPRTPSRQTILCSDHSGYVEARPTKQPEAPAD